MTQHECPVTLFGAHDNCGGTYVFASLLLMTPASITAFNVSRLYGL